MSNEPRHDAALAVGRRAISPEPLVAVAEVRYPLAGAGDVRLRR
jgi:hypothetical protein